MFIDFQREKVHKFGILGVWDGEYRGSLFSHQELAIATFQGLEVLAFQEEGVKKDDGVLKFIQLNCIPFSKRGNLPRLVADKVKERQWDPTWRNELTLTRSKDDFQNANNRGVDGKYFHIKVFNNHKDKIACNCVAYVERITDLKNGNVSVLELVELKWKGMRTLGVAIAPKLSRYLDAFHINFHTPNIVNLGLNPFVIDWEGYIRDYQIIGEGNYEIDYVVFSEEFSPARAKFKLHLDKQIQDSTFEIIAN